MTFAELLAFKDKAVEAKDEAASDLVEAQLMLETALDVHARATAACAAAHREIHDVLVEYGERCTVDDNGTVTIYRSVELDGEDDPGWRSYHPITEAMFKGGSK